VCYSASSHRVVDIDELAVDAEFLRQLRAQRPFRLPRQIAGKSRRWRYGEGSAEANGTA